MPKIPICPINLPCTLEPWGSHGRMKCLNSAMCWELAMSWCLPYEYDPEEKRLLVTCTPVRYKYDGENYEYINHNSEAKEIMRREWEEAGWARPVINKNYTGEEEDLGPIF